MLLAGPNLDHSDGIPERIFQQKGNNLKNQQMTKSMQNYPIGKELTLKLKPNHNKSRLPLRTHGRIQRGGQGVWTPPGKSQVVWVSIGNKKLDPPTPLEKVGHPLENVGPPSGTLENDSFL